MSNRTLLYLLFMVLVGMGIIFVSNLVTLVNPPSGEKYLRYETVRGSAVEREGKLFTLNFDQQQLLIQQLNQSIVVQEKSFGSESSKPDFEAIYLYRFNAPDIKIFPVAYDQGQLIFRVPEWNGKGYLRETGPGKLKEMLSNASTP